MKVVLQEGYEGHCPATEMWPGYEGPYIETPARAEAIKRMIGERFPESKMVYAKVNPDKWIRRIHSPAVVEALEQNTIDTIITKSERPDIILDSDSAISLSKRTYEAAEDSVSAALTGADLILNGESAVYALCRPPGHHATRTKMGGYCFFNNAAIAAIYLASHGNDKNVFVLDIDLHHGNGTQEILYGMTKTFFFSINCSLSYPGIVRGRESQFTNKRNVRNINLNNNAGDDHYMRAIDEAVEQMKGYDVLVISAGFDTSKDEPDETIGDSNRIGLSRDCFRDIGKVIEAQKKSTLIVQEGGYSPEVLAENVCAFLTAFAENR